MIHLPRFLLILIVGITLCLPVIADEPPVKKSNNNICHPKGGEYYSRTKNYRPYQTMEECMKSGGRKAKK